MRSLLPFFLLTIATALTAQDTHVYYNLFTDSLYFQRDGKTLRKPKLRKGDRVVVHFTEFNPYLFAAQSEVLAENDPAADVPTEGLAGSNPLAMLMPGMGMMGGAMPGFGGPVDSSGGVMGLSFMNKPLLSLGSASFRLKDLFTNESTEGSRGADELKMVQEQIAELSRLQADMERVYIEINESKQAVAAAAMAAPFFENVVKNPELRPSLIKKMGGEYAGLIYPGKNPAELEVRDAFGWQNRAAQHQQLLQEMADLQGEYAQKAAATGQSARQLEGIAEQMDNEGLSKFSSELLALGRQNTGFQKQATRYLASQQNTSVTTGLSMPELLGQQVRFREIASQNFTYETVVHVEDETTILSTTFTPLDSMGGAAKSSAGPAGKTKIVKLETAGGMRFTSGIGLAFGGFGDAAADFSVKNGEIVAEESSPLQPMLASFAHIFPRRKGRTTLGGSFGVGIPLGGGTVQMPHFFFGPTLFLGNQKVALTGGLMLGPVSRLANGYAPGDAFDLNVTGEIPTRSKYEAGWFVGFSFNMVR